MAGHPAFPDAQDRPRLAQHFRLVKENVTQPTADDHTKQRAAGDKVAQSLRRQIGIPSSGQPKKNEIAGDECEHIRESIPSWPDIVVNPKNDRVQIVQIVGKHLCGQILAAIPSEVEEPHCETER